MKTATLNTPQSLDPREATSIRLVGAHLVFSTGELQLAYEMVDAQGAAIAKRVVRVPAAVYVGNQEQTILNALLTRLGLAATVTDV